jgi:predicted CoA-binding protein
MKPTAVIGAHPSASRYSYACTQMLTEHGHLVWPLGIRQGSIGAIPIITDWDLTLPGLHTVTLYINPTRQAAHYDYITGLMPKRVIFNPGAENWELRKICERAGIESVEACTLVMLRTDQY